MSKDVDKIQAIINNSGNNLHSQVIQFLRKDGWTVVISPYYCDNQTNKAREIDIIAEKKQDFTKTRQNKSGTLNIKLYIECKYFKDELMFWFDEKDTELAEKMVFETTCIPEDIQNIPIHDRKYHYFSPNKVAKLFSSHPQKASENEDFFRAIHQTLNGMIYHKEQGSIITTTKKRELQYFANYPIILCNKFDKLYKTDIGEEKYCKIEASDFELEINYSYIGNSQGRVFNKYFLIDVVDFTKFEQYLKKIREKDVYEMMSCASF